jgi:hypothetical protein
MKLAPDSRSPAQEATCAAYLVDAGGVIADVTGGRWSRFAHSNGGEAVVAPAAVIGRPLKAFIAGSEMIEFDRRLREALLKGEQPAASYLFRCDSDLERRLFRMHMAPVAGKRGAFVLYRTVVADVQRRASARLLSHVWDASAPLLTICSFCNDVRHEGVWVPVEEYSRHGGSEYVRLSHGICPPCFAEVEQVFGGDG